jgi:hypothetical protein
LCPAVTIGSVDHRSRTGDGVPAGIEVLEVTASHNADTALRRAEVAEFGLLFQRPDRTEILSP